MLINRRYLLSIKNEFEKKLLDILFDNDKSFGLDHLLNIVGKNIIKF